MTPDEIGLLVMKVQSDDVLASDIRKFLHALMTDEEVRRNAKLVSGLSGLLEEDRRKYCRANVLMLLSSSSLGPTAKPDEYKWSTVTKAFVSSFYLNLTGTWSKHMKLAADEDVYRFQKQVRVALRKPGHTIPEMTISDVLASHVRVVEEFWGVRGYLVP